MFNLIYRVMKKLFLLAVAALTVCGVACTPEQGGGAEAPKGPFAIYTSAPLYNAIPVTVEPADAEAPYYFDVYEAAIVDQFETTDAFATALIEAMKKQAAGYGVPISAFLSVGTDSYLFEGLSAETEYYVFAFGVNPTDATLSTEVVLKKVKTAVRPELPAVTYYNYGYWENKGDAFGVGANTWEVDLYSDEPNEGVILYLQTADATTFVGEYTIAGTGAAGTAVNGMFNASTGQLGGSFIAQYNASNQITGAILFTSGTVVVEKEGENYKITIDAQTQNAISGAKDAIRIVYNAPLEEYVSTSTAAVKASTRRPATSLEISPIQLRKGIIRK